MQWVAVLAAILLTAADPVRACVDTSLRDAAFAEPRDVYRLTVMSGADDSEADATSRRLAEWLTTTGAGLNIKAARVNVEDPKVRWPDYGIPSAPPTHPAVVLGRYRLIEMQSLFVDHWEPAPTPEELEQIRSSPARESLRRELGRRLAVLLFIPGTGAARAKNLPQPGATGSLSARALADKPPVALRQEEPGAIGSKAVLDGVVRAWSDKTPLGLSIVQVDRSDARERLLLSFTGALRSDADWLAVVFGRGKFMPPIEGQDITAEALDVQLQLLLEDCACVRSVSSLGVDIPMVWTKAMDEAVVPLRTPTANPPSHESPASAATDVGVRQKRSPILRAAAYTLVSLTTTAVAAGALILVRQHRRRSSA